MYNSSGVAEYRYKYFYDNSGNLVNWYINNNDNTETYENHTYTYGNTSWADLLTAFDGYGIAYEGQTYNSTTNTVTGTAVSGNPISYYNGTRWDFTWQNGRQLATASKSGTSISYAYDLNGLRTSKTVNGVQHEYVYAGGKLLRETYGSNVLDFAYTASGAPFSITYNGTTYYYITNLQGDVMYLVNATGTRVAAYTYDPYGRVLTATGTMATVNPLRYRGYYYDTETGLYYVSSRYYDPEIGRFINADVYTSTGQGLLGNNIFAYCNNNPVNNVDPLGLWTISISGTLSGVFGLGISLSFGFAFDDQGNFDWQYSYAVPGVDNTVMVGGISAGAGIAIQYTKADTVYDLYGPATYVGASAGPGWYVGGDIVSFSDASDPDMTTDGFQFVAGVGVGVDVHVTESYTRSVVQTNRSAQSNFSGGSGNRVMYAAMLY